jgi:hypothetical protein
MIPSPPFISDAQTIILALLSEDAVLGTGDYKKCF